MRSKYQSGVLYNHGDRHGLDKRTCIRGTEGAHMRYTYYYYYVVVVVHIAGTVRSFSQTKGGNLRLGCKVVYIRFDQPSID